MNRRPTVPLADWRIAVHLDASAQVQDQPGTPAYSCHCGACEDWRRAWPQTLPDELAQQLHRLRIDLNRPTDLYAYERNPNGLACRAIFHCVGRMLEGPNCWLNMPDGSPILDYHRIRGGQEFIGLAVYPDRQGITPSPNSPPPSTGTLIQIDMRVLIPNRYRSNQDAESSEQGRLP